MEIKMIGGSVSAPKGFTAAGVHCGIRKNRTKRDLALIFSEKPCSAAAVYTTNKVKGAPILVDQQNLADGKAQAIICNSGNANTCNANGIEIAEGMCALVGKALNIDPRDVVVASTGVIGQPMSLEPIAAGIPPLAAALSKAGDTQASEAIMTTDTIQKEVAVSFTIGGMECKMGAIAKGSGMIHPNMATMLGFVTTDAAITPALLQKALSASVADTYNMVSVDGDTSTNDTVAVLANGMSGAPLIDCEGEDYEAFCKALTFVNEKIARLMASDGEGATKLLVVKVTGAADTAAAKTVAKSVCCSSLFKAAMFGADANWGRVLCAIGYANAPVDVSRVAVSFASAAGRVDVCQNGAGIPFSEELAKTVLSEKEIDVLITLGDGSAAATAYGCDLTYDYVKINGDYRT